MRRRLEFIFYAVFIIGSILINAVSEGGGGERRPQLPSAPQKENTGLPPVALLPDTRGIVRSPSPLPEINVDVDSKKGTSVGTGFVVSDTGRIITARHVVDGCQRVFVRETKNRYFEAEDVQSYRGVDFATLRVPSLHTATLDLDTTVSMKGDVGYMMGYPQGKPADLSARVIGHSTMRSRGRYDTRERVTVWLETERLPEFSGTIGGLSGGPVLDGKGHVIGTAVASSMRRGRIYTTNPSVFTRSRVIEENDLSLRRTLFDITPQNYGETGIRLRKDLTIVQIVCLVD
ncbi:endopeptidase DegP [Kordiimonas sediminis]|uniref:Endopeptidase DegP n=2 Tax=Kordiimonas sediminis TaxID=1735581 RepID=A0A919E3C0_9PROT|nr:endopeptidase DegP [Kordiimonas sediminis]